MKIGDWQTYEREMSEAAAAGDPTSMLVADHKWMRTIFDEMTRRMANDQSSIAELLPGLKEMAAALEVHIRQEEDIYFPAVKSLVPAARRHGSRPRFLSTR